MIGGEKLSTKKLAPPPPRVCKQFPDEFSWTRQKTAQSIMSSQAVMPQQSSIMSSIDDQHHLRAIIQSSYSSVHPQQYFFNSSIDENGTISNHRKQSLANIATSSSSSSSSHRSPSYRMYFSPQINSTAHSTHSQQSQSSDEFLRSFNLAVPPPSQLLNKNTKPDQDISTLSTSPLIPSSEFPRMLQHEMGLQQRKYFQSNQHLENKHNQLCSFEGSDSFEKSLSFAIPSGIRNPTTQNTGHSFLIKSQQSLRPKELFDNTILPSLAAPRSEAKLPLHHLPRYPSKQQSQPGLLKWESHPLPIHHQTIIPEQQQQQQQQSLASSEASANNELNYLSQFCAKQSKRSFEDSRQKVLQQLNAQSTDIFLKKASPTQSSQQKLQNINQFPPSILAQLSNQMNSIPKKDQSKAKIASSMPATRHGSPSSWASHQNSACLQSDQIIESKQSNNYPHQPTRMFGRNNSLANLQSEHTQMLRLPNILPDSEASKTTTTTTSQSSRTSQTSPIFVFEQKCENEQQEETSMQQIRDIKTPSFNHRQSNNKYPVEQEPEQSNQFGQTSYFGQITFHKQISVESHLNSSRGTPAETISTGISICHPDSDLNSSFGYNKHESQDNTETNKSLNQQRINQPANSYDHKSIAHPINKPPQLPEESIPTLKQQMSLNSSESTRSSKSRKLILSSQNILNHVSSSKLIIPQVKKQAGEVSLKSIKRQNQSTQIHENNLNNREKLQHEDQKEQQQQQHLNKEQQHLELTFNSQISTTNQLLKPDTEQKRKRRQKTEPISMPK